MAARKIRLLQINDGNVYEKKDNGLTSSNEETQTRASLRRALEMRYTLPDGRRLPLFVLAPDVEALPPSPAGPGDPFDDVFRDESGKLKHGSKEWHEVSAQLCAERNASAQRAEQEIKNKLQQSIGDNLAALLASQQKPVAQAAKVLK